MFPIKKGSQMEKVENELNKQSFLRGFLAVIRKTRFDFFMKNYSKSS